MADLATEGRIPRGAPAPSREARSHQTASALERSPFDGDRQEVDETLAQLARTTGRAIVCLISLDRDYLHVRGRHDEIRTPIPPASRLCAQALCQQGRSILVDDMLADRRFDDLRRDFPHFPLRTYAGLAVVSEIGQHLGVLCVADDREGPIPTADLDAMRRSAASLALRLAAHRRQTHERERMMRELCASAEAGRIPLVLQPIVRSTDLTAVTFEALARWRRADGTPVEPDSLFPLVERYARFAAVDRAILGAACEMAAGLPQDAGVSVNISPSWFRSSQSGLTSVVETALQATGLPASRLTLEVTENAVIEDPLVAQSQIRSLKTLGIQLALDDFGVGHSSLSRLADYPFDQIKLDRSFLTRIGEARAHDILRGVTVFIRSLGLSVCVEGVETRGQFDLMRELGPSLLQGFYIDQLSEGRRYVVGGQLIS